MANESAPNGSYDMGSISEYFTTPFVIRVSNIVIALFPNNISDITSLEFFNYTFYFQTSTGELFYPGSWDKAVGWQTQNMSAWVNGNGPDIALQVDGFAKALYSAVLVDLGQTSSPNALTNATALEHLLAVEDNMTWLPGRKVVILGNTTGQVYDSYSSKMGPLGTKPATIYQQYACSVPQQKGPGSLIISIVIADLVFLQALFTLLNMAATYWGSTKDPSWNDCHACKGKGAFVEM